MTEKTTSPDELGVASCSACRVCGGTGAVSYNPNLNPNAFSGSTSAKCSHCEGTGIMSEEDAYTYDDENNYANREDSEQASRSGLHWTHS